MVFSCFGGDGEREGGVDDAEPYHDLRLLKRREKDWLAGRDLGVCVRGVVAAVEAVREDSMLLLAALGRRSEEWSLLFSSSAGFVKRCTVIFGLLCSWAISSRAWSTGTLGSMARFSSGVVQPEESGGEMSARSSADAIRSASEKLPLIVTIEGLAYPGSLASGR